MSILTKATVLVLNCNWQAINVRTPQEAFCMMATNVDERLCAALRGNRTPVIAEFLELDGSRQVFRARRPKKA